MPRKLVALLVSLFAVAFAFGAMAAIRWPSIVMILGMINEDNLGPVMAEVDWRELGIHYGLPYFLAAMCLYTASILVTQRRHGALSWYLMGCAAGFPYALLVDFEAGWWRDPSTAEGAVAGAGATAVLLAIAMWDLRKGKKLKAKPEAEPEIEESADGMVTIPAALLRAMATNPALSHQTAAEAPAKPKVMKRPPPMVMAQRAHFAREGRKMMAKKAARRG
ncbi:MAG: hypothetical protein MRY64_06810 [Hyphomonadaceae bacterium]|nr:hypothetical protein [Hyphomonadaceae bacterium]